MTLFNNAKWIVPDSSRVILEPEFSLAEMFSGENNGRQSSPEERLLPPKYLFKEFENKSNVREARLRITTENHSKRIV
ncbi:MAG: hypothetical protein SOZ13_04715 [Enterococcus avium]|uniref:Uncharacterized protein n=1 Tax=Enterococcus avium TaxID=33945 RepID=A0A437UHV0_ENTAV|nr:hypothetical protein [Enterococcus avium]MDY4024378.1 hypothetical protein [Enterococcus avium]RVU93220.1 hypothetical protein EK398_22600 [Enterococcus avium]